VKLHEPAADLAVALAIASAALDVPVPPDLVALGEVGLAGELRQVVHTPRRLAEAGRLGFRRALMPASAPVPPDGVQALRAGDLDGAIRILQRGPVAPTRPKLVAVDGGRRREAVGLPG
jgi:DNA repair protein RadA/Sms